MQKARHFVKDVIIKPPKESNNSKEIDLDLDIDEETKVEDKPKKEEVIEEKKSEPIDDDELNFEV